MIIGGILGFLAGWSVYAPSKSPSIHFLGKEWNEDYELLGGESPVYTCEWDNVHLWVQRYDNGTLKSVLTFCLNPITKEWITNGLSLQISEDGSLSMVLDNKGKPAPMAFLPMQGFPLPD